MIKNLKQSFGPVLRKGMIEAGHQVKHNHGSSEDADPDNRRCSRRKGRYNEHRRNGNRSQKTNTMADAIGDFFAPGLVTYAGQLRVQFSLLEP